MEKEEMKVIYLDGRLQAKVALHIGSEKEAHVVVIAEAL